MRIGTAVVAVVLVVGPAGAQLREPEGTPPPALVSRAVPLSSRWIQLVLPENAYTSVVAEPARYTITSTDDPTFASPVVPIAVDRRHFPEDAWYAGSHEAATIATIHVTYRVFLELDRSLTEGMHYRVTVDAAALADPGPFDFVMGDEPSEALHVNQVSYLAAGPKVAYLSTWTGQRGIDFGAATEFQVIDEADDAVAYTGTVVLDDPAESWSGSALYSMDFSALTAEGSYHLVVPTVGRSYSFAISASAFNRIGYTVIRGVTLQRDGQHGLDATVTRWARPPAHLDDAIDEYTGGRVDLVGGHMDAGDRGKYPHNSADMAGSLLCALALFPDQIEAFGEQLEIPESDNGIPDFVDETIYALDYLAKTALNTSREGVQPYYLRPANDGYEQGYPLEGATGRVFWNATRGPYRAETLYVAGALAMAAATPLIQQYAPDKAEVYRQGALRTFAAFEASYTNDAYWQNDIHPYDNWTSGPHPWSDEMLMAAASLYELTGESKYLDWVNAEMPADLGATRLWGWVLEGPWLSAYVALHQASRLDVSIRDRARDGILAWADSVLQPNDWPAPYGAPLPSFARNQVGWYFSASQVAFPMMVAYGVSGDDRYRDVLIRTWSYLLGGNPLSRSYVSGLGRPDRRPRWIVHEIAQYQWAEQQLGNAGWNEMPPGIYSADLQQGYYEWYLADDGWNSARMDNRYPALDAYPPLHRYHDSWTVTDEFTINQLARGAASVAPLLIAGGPGPDPGGDGGVDGGPGGDGGGGGCCGAGGGGSDTLLLVALVALLAGGRRRFTAW